MKNQDSLLNPDFKEISRHLPIFTGRLQPTIFGASELNFCVRNGNRWDLTAIDTGRSFSLKDVPSKLNNKLLANEVSMKLVVKPSIY